MSIYESTGNNDESPIWGRLLIGVGVLAIVVMVVLSAYYFFWVPAQVDDDIVKDIVEKEELSSDEVAGMVLDLLDEQRTDDGVYLHHLDCETPGGCETGVDNRVGIIAIWAKYRHFGDTSDESDLAAIEADLDIYLDDEKVPMIQNYYWNCAVMYEIAVDEKVPADIADKAWKVCEKGLYDPVKEQEARDVMANLTDSRAALSSYLEGRESAIFAASNENVIFEYASYASDYAAKYQKDNDDDDLLVAEGLLRRAGTIYRGNSGDRTYVSPGYDCTMSVAAVDLYRATDEDEYLEFAEEVVDFGLAEESDVLFDKAVCAYSANLLFEETSKAMYQQTADRLLDMAVDQMFDYEGYDGYFDGLGGFVVLGTTPVRYPTFENSVLVYSLLEK